MRNQLRPRLVVLALAVAAGAPLDAQSPQPGKVCLAPTTVEASSNAATAIEAVRASFTAFLTGPSISSQPLQSRLASQVREEAKQAGCPYLLLTTLKVVGKRSGGGLLGQVAAGAVRQGAYEAAGVASGTTAGRIAGTAAAGALHQATYNYAVSIRNRDELTLGWRLEGADGTVLVEQRDKRTAKSDGEDVLTPLTQVASEQIVEATRRRAP